MTESNDNRYRYFELRRQSDDLVYQFDRMIMPDGRVGYKRRDKDLWITHRPSLGWVAYDDETDSLQGRPWTVQPEAQEDHPPAGEWVSKKGVKSYVYELVYVEC